MKRIYVGNLSRETTEQALQTMFGEFGDVLSVDLIRDRVSGESRGFAFVEMNSDQEASAAIAGLNGKEVDGRVLKVDKARAREEGGGGGSRGGEGGGRRRW